MKTYWAIVHKGETRPCINDDGYVDVTQDEHQAKTDAEYQGFDVLPVHILPTDTLAKVREALEEAQERFKEYTLHNVTADYVVHGFTAALAALETEGEKWLNS